MNQPAPLYVTEPALSLLDPWLRQHLPDRSPAVLRRFIQLVSGIFETRSLLRDGNDSRQIRQIDNNGENLS